MSRAFERVLIAILSGALILLSSAPVRGQANPPRPTTDDPTWEVEVHAGATAGNQPTAGTGIGAFPAGESFVALNGRSSRYASTWFFGDGAALINQIAAGFIATTVGSRLTPLDPVLTASSVE